MRTTILPSRALPLLIAGVCALAGQGRGSLLGPPPQVKGAAQKPKIDARAVIDKLANRNPVPKLVGPLGELDPIFAETYDWKEYRRVWAALRELAPKAEALWPELVKHLDDDRYCMTALTWSDNTHNLTVGDVCHELIADTLSEAYYRHLEPNSVRIHGRMHQPPFAGDKKGLKAWCLARSDNPLYELQMEACRWAVKELTEGENLPEVSDSRRRAWIASVEAEIKALAKSKRAVPSGWFGGEGYTPFSAERAEELRKKHARKKTK